MVSQSSFTSYKAKRFKPNIWYLAILHKDGSNWFYVTVSGKTKKPIILSNKIYEIEPEVIQWTSLTTCRIKGSVFLEEKYTKLSLIKKQMRIDDICQSNEKKIKTCQTLLENMLPDNPNYQKTKIDLERYKKEMLILNNGEIPERFGFSKRLSTEKIKPTERGKTFALSLLREGNKEFKEKTKSNRPNLNIRRALKKLSRKKTMDNSPKSFQDRKREHLEALKNFN